MVLEHCPHSKNNFIMGQFRQLNGVPTFFQTHTSIKQGGFQEWTVKTTQSTYQILNRRQNSLGYVQTVYSQKFLFKIPLVILTFNIAVLFQSLILASIWQLRQWYQRISDHLCREETSCVCLCSCRAFQPGVVGSVQRQSRNKE